MLVLFNLYQYLHLVMRAAIPARTAYEFTRIRYVNLLYEFSR